MTYCCVPNCKNNGGNKFPKEKKLRKAWEIAVRRKNWHPTSTSVVCSAHFKSDDFHVEGYTSGLKLSRKRLKTGAVPTVFPWKHQEQRKCAAVQRGNRAKNRCSKFSQSTNSVNLCHPLPPEGGETEATDLNLSIGREEQVLNVTDKDFVNSSEKYESVPIYKNASVQTVTEPRFSVTMFVNNPKVISFYTGLESYEKFCLVLVSLGPAVNSLQYYRHQILGLSIENQFFLTLMKLRRNKALFELGVMFEISDNTASNIFITWVNFMAHQWSELNLWPCRELVNYYMPQSFKRNFASTRVIIDGTEFPIEKPMNPTLQQASFSTYKNKNTLKVLVGSTPGGLMSYCSEAYGGATSDRQIVERSNLIEMCSPKDSIMADRGFTVQDLFAPKDITINMPTFLKGKTQLPGLTVLSDRKIASKRVHIERLIGLTKTYKILKQDLNTQYVKFGSEIFFSCVMLCNFREGIVNKNIK